MDHLLGCAWPMAHAPWPVRDISIVCADKNIDHQINPIIWPSGRQLDLELRGALNMPLEAPHVFVCIAGLCFCPQDFFCLRRQKRFK